MPRLRRYLLPLLLLLPVIFICGKLLLTWVESFEYGEKRERGWPWVFQIERAGLRPSGVAFWPLLTDLTVLALAIGVGALLLHWLWRRSGGWHRFSLRGIFALVAIAAVICGWWTSNSRQHHREQKLLESGRYGPSTIFSKYCGPAWARRLLPKESARMFYRLTLLQIPLQLSHDKQSSVFPRETMADLPSFTHLQAVQIYKEWSWPLQTPYPPLQLSEQDQRSLQHIEMLGLNSVSADDETIRAIATLPRLRKLEIRRATISTAGLESLSRCRQLDTLVLSDCEEITDDFAAALTKIPSLQSLTVQFCGKLTDEGIAALAELPNLKELLVASAVDPSSKTIERLRRRIPGIFVGGKWLLQTTP